jgi:type IV pilus assembly protein PilA
MFNRKGFTLIELLIVVVIIGILAAIAIPKFATTKDKAKLASIKTDLRNLMTAEEAYFSDYSTYTAGVGQITAAPYNFSFSSGNTIQTVTGVASGWTAAVTNNSISTGSTNTCTVQVGAGAVSTLDGVIHCP